MAGRISGMWEETLAFNLSVSVEDERVIQAVKLSKIDQSF
jgi:hypothetical protein